MASSDSIQSIFLTRRKPVTEPIGWSTTALSRLDQCQTFLSYFVDHFQNIDWFPDDVVGRAKHNADFLATEMGSISTLYHYIDAQPLEVRNIDLKEKTHRRNFKHQTVKHKWTLGCGIEKRPQVDDRSEFGHFEIDTIVGKRNGHESVVWNLIKCQTRIAIL